MDEARRVASNIAKPPTFLRCRALLIESRPHHRAGFTLPGSQKGAVVVASRVVPQELSEFASQEIPLLCYRRN